MGFEYPQPRRDDTVVDCFHGTLIRDPYRWLEDPDSEETKAFVDAQNEITNSYLQDFPYRDIIKETLTSMWNFPKYSIPYKRGGKYFFFKNTGLQNQSVLYVQDSLDGESRVFLDPNTFSEEGTAALSDVTFSDDGTLLAYGVAENGSDWFTVHFKNVETGKEYCDLLTHIKYSKMTWTFDNKGIFYAKCQDKLGATGAEKEQEQKLYYHVLGTEQCQDIIVAELSDLKDGSQYMFEAEISDCGRYLILLPYTAIQKNLVFICDLQENCKITGKLTFLPIVTELEANFDYITNDGTCFIFETNYNAPNDCLIQIDLHHPDKKCWTVLIPEHPQDILVWAACVNENNLVICYSQNVKHILQLWSITSASLITNFPMDLGTIMGYSGRRHDTEIFYLYVSCITPSVIYRCDLTKPNLEPTIFKEVKLEGFDPSNYTLEQVFFKSKDCTTIPMFICYKNNIPRDGSAPCLLYGYGGFNISILPTFSITRATFMKYFDGIAALPNIRGGGEYGETWHDGGRNFNKQNCFDDFCAAAEYLVRNCYTSHNKITIQGASNGGLLVGACINQRPELFGAAIAEVGVMDMLRFHKFTIGYAWSSDYGTPDDEKQFRNLLCYSPLHNVHAPNDEEHQYPATLIMTADHDDRVVPLHSIKLIATLQHAVRDCPYQKNPVLIRVDTKAGHGAGMSSMKIIEEVSDIFCFIAKSLNLKIKFNKGKICTCK